MIHANSLAAFQSIADLGDRQRAVYDAFALGDFTDRAVSQILGREMYTVRPRVSELVRAGLLIEVGHATDPITRRTVRICARRDL